jgi:hypothetical protein
MLSGTNLSNSSVTNERNNADFYSTPPEAVEALLAFLPIPKRFTIWEPACGQGYISEKLIELGYQVESTDLFDHGYKKAKWPLDFLAAERKRGDIVITNPPFAYAEDFIRHAARLDLEGFAFLLKSQFWHARRRLSLFEEIRPDWILPLTWRLDFCFGTRGGAPTMDCLWAIWLGGKDQRVSTLYQPLKRPTRAAKMNV